jgi:hypothetical protein
MRKFKFASSVAAAALMSLAPGKATAAVICNTPPAGSSLPIAVPATTAGVYVNFVTGAFGTAAATPGWDINPWGSTAFNYFWATAAGNVTSGILIGGVHAASDAGVLIDATGTYAPAGTPTAAQMAPWRAGVTDKYIGIRFNNESTATTNFGWAKLSTTGPNGIPATLSQFCYQNDGSGILTGQTGFVKGDFNNDGQPDLLFRNVTDGTQNKIWFMDGVTRTTEAAITPNAASTDWIIRGSDDFDSFATPGTPGGDDNNDLVFWNQTTGAVEFWAMNGTDRPGAAVPLTGGAPLPTNWDLSATGDFNGDDRPDLVWRNFTSQKIVIWKMGEGAVPGTQKTGNIIPNPDQAVNSNWIIVAAADYTNDGNTDFLWYNYTSGKIVTWYMDASVVRTSGQFTTPDAAGNNNWKVVASSDYSRNYTPGTPPTGSNDIVWRNETSGNQVVWHMDFNSTRVHGQFTNPTANTVALDWVIVGPR